MIKILFRKIKRLARFNRLQLTWLLPLYFLSGVMRLTILTLPFRWITPCLGQHNNNIASTLLVSRQQEEISRQAGILIAILSKYIPWESKCLVQAILARIILHWHKIPHSIYLGVNQSGNPDNPDNPLNAHAWVTVGSRFVTGGNSFRQFGVVACFTSEPVQAGIENTPQSV